MTVDLDGMTEEQRAEYYDDALSLSEGIDSQFWRTLKKILLKNESDAFQRWLNVDPKEHAAVSELQMLAKVSRTLVNVVEDSAAFVEHELNLKKQSATRE